MPNFREIFTKRGAITSKEEEPTFKPHFYYCREHRQIKVGERFPIYNPPSEKPHHPHISVLMVERQNKIAIELIWPSNYSDSFQWGEGIKLHFKEKDPRTGKDIYVGREVFTHTVSDSILQPNEKTGLVDIENTPLSFSPDNQVLYLEGKPILKFIGCKEIDGKIES